MSPAVRIGNASWNIVASTVSDERSRPQVTFSRRLQPTPQDSFTTPSPTTTPPWGR